MSNHARLAPASGVEHFKAAQYFFVASCAILLYDHALTFSQEVDRVWKQRLTVATLLFIIIRYLTPLELIVFFLGFEDPALSVPTRSNNQATCDGFVKFPGAATLTSIALIEIIMSLRTYALYGCNVTLLICLLVLLGCQAGAMGVLIANGRRVPFPKGATGCILTGKDAYLAAFWLSPLALDTLIFALTLYKTRQCRKRFQEVSLLRMLMKDGIMYYVVICGVNLLNVLLYLSAPLDLKAIGATFSQVMTTVMISRLVMNLQGFRTKHSLERWETVNLDQTRTDSAVLTTQFQFDSQTGPSLDLDDPTNLRSLHNTSRRITHTWLGSLGDRLTDDEWGLASVRAGEQDDAVGDSNLVDPRDEQEMQIIVSSR